jgi:putative DNA primase/helicase
MEEVTVDDPDTRRLLKQWFGYLLWPSDPFESFLVAVGEAAAGKGTCAGVAVKMLGAANCSGLSPRRFVDQFSLYHSYGKMLNVVDESDAELTPQIEEVIKIWTGKGILTFEKKYGETIHSKATAKLMMLGNSLPTFTDKTNGTWRRLKIAPFHREHPEIVDGALDAKLERELPGIFNWAVEGLQDLLQNNGFTIPETGREAWEESKREANPAGMFLEETYRYDQDADGIPRREAYALYRVWCKNHGNHPLNDSNFGKQVRRVFPKVKDVQKRNEKGRTWLYSGMVKL